MFNLFILLIRTGEFNIIIPCSRAATFSLTALEEKIAVHCADKQAHFLFSSSTTIFLSFFLSTGNGGRWGLREGVGVLG